MASSRPSNRVLAIIGATGTGKSQLAVDLAKQFNGEIINGDAMQMYDGLPIITNKITVEEQRGIPHHLLGCVRLDEEPWRVGRFVKAARSIIGDIHSRRKLPILVGGTHYYTQSLLFNDKLAGEEEHDDEQSGDDADSAEKWPILEAPTEKILAKLKEADPIMADRWHPEDRRKIRRSLEIYLQTGQRASELYEAQQQRWKHDAPPFAPREALASGLRYPTLFLWVHAPTPTLRPRLDARIETMLRAGLLAEVASLATHLATHPATDPSRGIWVSIGYKEFLPYTALLADPSGTAEALEAARREGVERTKIATRQYAKRQVKWIRSKLLSVLREHGALGSIFVLDAEKVEVWEEAVLGPAVRVVGAFLEGGELPRAVDVFAAAGELLVDDKEDLSQRRDLWKRRTCEVCGVTAVTGAEWERHVQGRKHRNTVKARRKREGGERTQQPGEEQRADEE